MTLNYDDPRFADELGRTIRLLRIDRRIERRDLAEQVGISYSYLSAIENGSKTPSARLLYSIAQALGLRDDELLATVRERIAAPPATAAESTAAPPPAPMAASAPTAPAPQAGQAATTLRTILGRRGRPAGSGASERRRELVEIIERLDPDDADAVLDMARRLAGR